MAWVRVQLCKLQKGCTRLATTSDKVYQLLAHGRRFSAGTPATKSKIKKKEKQTKIKKEIQKKSQTK
jgi:hypothetical protein